MLLRKGVSLLTLLTLMSLPCFGQDARVASSSSSERFAKRAGLRVEVSTGFGSFNSVVIPGQLTPFPSDLGRNEKAVTANHQGIPVSIMGGWYGRYGAFRPSVDLSYLKIDNMKHESTDRQTSSGYSRWQLATGSDYWFNRHVAGVAKLLTRRNFYSNRSESHILDAILPGAGAKLSFGNWESELSGYYAAYSQFGFNDNAGFGRKGLGNTKTSIYGYEWCNSFRISSTGSLVLGFHNEVADITVQNVAQYSSYGYTISPVINPERSYQLSTTIFSLGFMKAM